MKSEFVEWGLGQIFEVGGHLAGSGLGLNDPTSLMFIPKPEAMRKRRY